MSNVVKFFVISLKMYGQIRTCCKCLKPNYTSSVKYLFFVSSCFLSI